MQDTPVDEDVKEDVPLVKEKVVIDSRESSYFGGYVSGVSEEFINRSLSKIRDVFTDGEIDKTKIDGILSMLKMDTDDADTFKENLEMLKDPIIGAVLEMVADDCSVKNPITDSIVSVQSDDAGLQTFLNDFLEKNFKVNLRHWELAHNMATHGDLKLRRQVYSDSDGVKGVYYELVLNPYSVSRIEYLGQVLGYIDEEDSESKSMLRDADAFVHFFNTKLMNKKAVELKITETGEEDIDFNNLPNPDIQDIPKKLVKAVKVRGTSLVDTARYVFRIVRLLDDILITTRIARSSQFNLVKVEVGNASPTMTNQILMEAKRRIEGRTSMKKGSGMSTSTSSTPVNTFIYTATREGKGDITVESVNDSSDVHSILDIDRFDSKLFAALKTNKVFLGYDEALTGQMSAASLAKLDIRYARMAQRNQNSLEYGYRELLNNYLRFRGRVGDQDNFKIILKSVNSAEQQDYFEEFNNRLDVFTKLETIVAGNEDFIDKAKLLLYILRMLGFNADAIVTNDFRDFIKNYDENPDTEWASDKPSSDAGSTEEETPTGEEEPTIEEPTIEEPKTEEPAVGSEEEGSTEDETGKTGGATLPSGNKVPPEVKSTLPTDVQAELG